MFQPVHMVITILQSSTPNIHKIW